MYRSRFTFFYIFFLILFSIYFDFTNGNLMTDDDTDLLEHQTTLKSQILEEKSSGTTYINPATGRPFPVKHWDFKSVDPSHRKNFEEEVARFSQNKKSKNEIKDQIDTSFFNDNFLTEELSHAIELCDSSSSSDHSEAISIFRALAEDKNPIAAYHLGIQLQFGRIVERDYEESLRYFMIGCEFGYPPAQREVAFMKETGKGVPVNPAEALVYYTIAAKAHDIEASLVLGHKYSRGISVPKSCPTAAIHYRDVAEHVVKKIIDDGYDNSGYVHFVDLFEYEKTGEHPAAHEADVVEYMEYAADNGDPLYQLQIGLMFLYGVYDHPIDYHRAREYLELAHEAEDPEFSPRATALLGSLYEDAMGVEQCNDTAVEFYKQSHDLGNVHGTFYLGRAYLRGTGVEQNFELALQYLTEAADKIHIQASTELGKMYYHGLGVPFDYAKAATLFNTAAVHDNAEAKFYFAKMNHHGLGIPERCGTALLWYQGVTKKGEWIYQFETATNEYINENYDIALLIYEKLALQGFPMAQFNAAYIFDQNLQSKNYLSSEENNKKKAFEYYSFAAEQGNSQAHLRLGNYYFYGDGERDFEISIPLAAAHYSAVGKTNGEALFNLGYLHQYGIGVVADRSIAIDYYTRAMEVDENAFLACMLSLSSLGFDFVVEKYQTNSLGDVLPALWDYMMNPSVFTKFAEQLETDLEDLEKLLNEELEKAEAEAEAEYGSTADWASEFSFLDKDFGLGYTLDTILITLLCVIIGIIFLFRQGFIQVQVERR